MTWRPVARMFWACLALMIVAACTPSGDMIATTADACSSTLRADQPRGPVEFSIRNDDVGRSAIVMGTYQEGFGRDDLVAYGRDVTTRPPFITALEIFEVAAGETAEIVFDHGPGTYFVACMPDPNSMIVLDDLVVGNG